MPGKSGSSDLGDLMRLMHPLTIAALLAVPTIALAQTTDRDQSGAAPGASSGAGSYGKGAAMTSATDTAASLTPGLPVKDKTGAMIGKVADVKIDTAGKKVATIKMGADSFAVDASALAVDKGVATINASQAEITTMLGKTK
jgi:hypothetical protein